MKKIFIMLLALAAVAPAAIAQKGTVTKEAKTLNTQWNGKTAVYLGDSMTDSKSTATTCMYWAYLEELMGIKPLVYGINGHQWDGVLQQAKKLKADNPKFDAIFIFAGTNDFNNNTAIGSFYNEDYVRTRKNNDPQALLRHRTLNTNTNTFTGRINNVLSYLKDNFPDKQIIIMTPIHRALADFGKDNYQPTEDYANYQRHFVDEYVQTLREASSIWSMPCIDLFAESGLYPLSKPNLIYFHDAGMDQLHPNYLGNYRIARVMQFKLLSIPPTF